MRRRPLQPTGGTRLLAADDDAITVGSFDFTESVILAEVYSQGLEAAGFDVDRAFSLGPREFAGPALTSGLIEFLPEYAGTASEFHSGGDAEPTDDVAATHDELVAAIGGRGRRRAGSRTGPGHNTFVVTVETARRLGIESLGDLGAVAGSAGLRRTRRVPATAALPARARRASTESRSREVVSLDAGGPLTVRRCRAARSTSG